MSEASSTNFDTILGRLVVENGLATGEEVATCQRIQRDRIGESDANQQSLADMLVDQGVVTKRQIERIRPKAEEQGASKKIKIPGFKVLRGLGAGGMAKVYLARQLSLDRLVAIKILPDKYTNNERFVERFYAEGKAAAKLNHPNIVGALDVGRNVDRHYFVMEYVDGKTVYDVIADKGQYRETDAINVILQIAEALDHAHKAGLIHRDVKPKNVMITKDGVAKLADMGLARPVDDREAAEAEKGKAYGTPYFISPEQIRGLTDVDCRADIYSLGATFYHMVTGQVPFEGSNPSEVMHKHLKKQIVPPDEINQSLTAGVCEIIEICMAKAREKRYNSVADLLEDLNAVQRGEPPALARMKFDLSALSELEATATDAQMINPPAGQVPATVMDQPLFWFALVGWLAVAILAIVMAIFLAVSGSV